MDDSNCSDPNRKRKNQVKYSSPKRRAEIGRYVTNLESNSRRTSAKSFCEAKRQKKTNDRLHDTNDLAFGHVVAIASGNSDTTSENSVSCEKPSVILSKLDLKMSPCAFCHPSERTAESGPLLAYAQGKEVVGDVANFSKVIHVHERCRNCRRSKMESSRISDGESQNTKLILKTAIASRITVLALTILWRSIASPYDTSASINPPPDCLTSTNHHNYQSILFPRIAAAIENGIVWDSVYFIRIAQCGGYEYEQTYAFLPLYPFCISLFSQTVLRPLIPLVGHRAVLALSGYALSNISFVFAALFFYRLSVIILKDSEASLRASILFCFNPASIFYSSIYSESLYALLSIGGLHFLMLGANNLATLWFALSGCARSNGVLNAGYIGFQTIHRAYDAVFHKRSTFLAVQVFVSGILRCVFVFVPFVAFQAYGYFNLCDGHDPDKLRPWCKAKIPLLYNFIQSHYWGVGFLRYFQIKQLPNFLLASPILSIAVCSIIHYVKLQPKIFFSLGFQVAPKKHGDANVLLFPGASTNNTSLLDRETSTVVQEDQVLRRRKHYTKEEGPPVLSTNNVSTEKLGDFSVIIIPFVLHLSFMVATAFFVMHVQVATRFLSSSPPIYWFASYVLVSPRIQRGWRYLIWGYCAAYILLGSLLFSNFYPFT